MKVLWTHNFDSSYRNAGVFMHTLAEGVRAAGVDLELLYLGNLRSARGMCRARAGLAVRDDVDLVHAQYGSACALATQAWRAGPKVLTLRGSDWQAPGPASLRWRAHGHAASALTRLTIRSFDSVICVSRRMAEGVRRQSGVSNVVVMPSPVDLDLFRPRDRFEARARRGLDQDAKYALYTAVDPTHANKRFGLAEAAFKVARASLPELKLVVGTDIDHAEMPWLVSSADLVLLTSQNEGWPNCIKEGLAANVPFVATDVSDLSQIADAESTCRVVDGTPQALGAAIIDVLRGSEPMDLPRYVADMSLDASVARLVALYEDLLR